MDFNEAGPIRFGLGSRPVGALEALNDQLRKIEPDRNIDCDPNINATDNAGHS